MEAKKGNNMVTAELSQLPTGSGNELEVAGTEVAVLGLPSQNPLLASAFKIIGAGGATSKLQI